MKGVRGTPPEKRDRFQRFSRPDRDLTVCEKGGDAYGANGIYVDRAYLFGGRNERSSKEGEPTQEKMSKVQAHSLGVAEA